MAKNKSVYAQMIKIWVDDERDMRRIIQKNGWREV